MAEYKDDTANAATLHETLARAVKEIPIDTSVLDQYRDLQDEGDADIVTELIDTFFNDLPERVSGIRDAVKAGNATELEREAHNLKGSSANLGAGPLSVICYELEKRGRDSQMADVADVVEYLESEVSRVRIYLESQRQD